MTLSLHKSRDTLTCGIFDKHVASKRDIIVTKFYFEAKTLVCKKSEIKN